MGREFPNEYYEAKKGRPHAKLLSEALEVLGKGERALDLGAGALNDAKYLLERGFEVVAVDKSPRILEFAREVGHPKLQAIQCRFEEFDFPESAFDLINAQFSLPFVAASEFPAVFERIRSSLRPKGVFVGQLFGTDDGWNGAQDMTFHTCLEALKLFGSMRARYFEEVNREGKATLGKPKHWHVFHIIAKNN